MRKLQFKFPSQIRISGWDFGSSARAMNQAGGKDSLMTYERELATQAVRAKYARMTFERKSMSTKTTIKRIALVAVSALGLGMVSTVAANAVATASFSVNTSSITVVTNGSTTSTDVTNGAIFKISLTPASGTAAQALQTDETLTASVVAVPAGTGAAKTLADNAADLTLTNVLPGTNDGSVYASGQTFTTDTTAGGGTGGTFNSTNPAKKNSITSGKANSYYLRVIPGSGKTVINQGTYTIRLRLTSNNGALLVQDSTVKVTFVSSAVSSGAALSVATSGAFAAATVSPVYAATKYMKATLTDANGGRLVYEGTAGTTTAPSLTVDLVDADGAVLVVSTSNFSAVDGANSYDYGYSGTADDDVLLDVNGTYGLKALTTDSFPASAIGSTNKIRVRYGSASATGAISIINAPTTGGSVDVTAAGAVATGAAAYTVPLTTKTVDFVVNSATAGSAYTYTVTWSNYGTGDVTPVSATPTVVYANSTGKLVVSITNAAPINGAVASVAFGGFSSGAATQTITWKSSAATTMTATMHGAYVKRGSTNTVVATVVDAFGAPVSGVVLQPSLVSGSINYSATATFPSVTTDAKGEASFTWTDAAAAATGDADTVKFTHLTSSTPITAATSTITYAATAPAVTALTAYSNATPSSATLLNTTTAVSGTVYTDGVSGKFAIEVARNNASTTAASGSHTDQLAIRVAAGAVGAPITASASAGAYVLNASDLQKSTYTQYTGTSKDALFVVGTNASGTNTITFTSGTVTTTVKFASKTNKAFARNIALTTSNGEVTATVTDRYGNAVSGVGIQISTSAGTLGNGQKVSTYTTDSSGSVTVIPVVSGDATITATITDDYTDASSAAGYVTTWSTATPPVATSTKVESTVKAGNDEATLAFAGTSVSSSDSVDAANEATDAANAATDAANAAAEAADAATAAAQDAQAAVAALATQVASLIAGIKAQITTLTNLVIKIQKKVRA